MIRVIIVLFVMVLQGCSHNTVVDYALPRARLQPPEVSGETHYGNASFSSDHQTRHKVTSIKGNNDSEVVGINDNELIEHSSEMTAVGNIGISRRWDLYTRISLDSPLIVGAQYQFLGNTKSQNGFKGLIALGYGEYSEEDDTSDGNDLELAKVKLNVRAFDGLFGLGYRFHPTLLIYSNYYYTFYDVNSEVRANGRQLNFSNDTSSEGYSMGLEFTYIDLTFLFEAGEGKDANTNDSLDYDFAAFSLGFNL